MIRPRLGLGCALACVVAASGCARRLDEKTRRAWKTSSANDEPGSDDGGGKGNGKGPSSTPTRVVYGWERVEEMLESAVTTMQRSPDDEALARLAQRWCEAEPEVRDTDDGPVRTCEPSPAVIVDGVRFTLELGGPGVIGLVATEVSAADSVRVTARARRAAERWCSAPWTDVPASDDDPKQQQFATCPIDGGPLFAVGRFALDKSAQRWQVSVAVVGAS